MKRAKEPVRLREKSLGNGVKSLYLDMYVDGVRRYEFLKLYINPGADPLTRAKNKSALEAARMLQAQRLVEIQSSAANIMSAEQRRVKFVDYYNEFYKSRSNVSPKYLRDAEFALKRWVEFNGEDVHLVSITSDMLVGFIKYLRNARSSYMDRQVKIHKGEGREESYISTREAEEIVRELRIVRKESYAKINRDTGINYKTIQYIEERILNNRRGRQLSDATVKGYFKYIATSINNAFRKGLIPTNPIAAINPEDKPRGLSPERTFLTLNELEKLVETPCSHPIVKSMFLFSCFTGLRLSDVKGLTWRKIDDCMLGTTMQKTHKPIYIPVSDNARRWLPERGSAKPDDKVFAGCYCDDKTGDELAKWCRTAGIDKHVTFHIARHTFATMTLEYGADLYTISKLLGHQSINTTQIYAKVVDSRKKAAVDAIPLLK